MRTCKIKREKFQNLFVLPIYYGSISHPSLIDWWGVCGVGMLTGRIMYHGIVLSTKLCHNNDVVFFH